MEMLTEEAESFAQNDDDVGRIEGLQMNLELSDTIHQSRKPMRQYPVHYMLKLTTILKTYSTGEG